MSTVANVIIRINDKDVTNSFAGITKEVNKLEKELRGTIRGTDEWNKKFAEVQEAKKHLESVRKEIGYTQKILKETTDTGSGFKAIFTGNIAADFFQTATQTAMQFGRELIQRVDELNQIKGTLSTLDENLKGTQLNKAAASVKAISDTYGKGVEEIQSAIKGLNAQTGDTNKSLDLIKKGFEAGADASGEMLTQLKEYPTMMNDARVSAEEMIAIMAHSEKMGVYDDKGIDALKEGMLRVREGTKSTQDAMKALGIDTESVYTKIKAGTLTYFDVIKMVSGKLKEVGADSRITGTAIADIFGGPGEDASYRYLASLGDIDTNLNNLLATSSDYNVLKAEELKANEKLNNVYSALTKGGSALNSVYNYLKYSTADFLSNVLGIRNAKLSEEYQTQGVKLQLLGQRLNAHNISEKERLSIYTQLKTEYPQYFKNLDLEKMKHEDIAKAIQTASNELRKKYQLQALNETLEEKGDDFKGYTKTANGLQNLMDKAITETYKKIPSLSNLKLNGASAADNTAQLLNYLKSNKDIDGNNLGTRRTLENLLSAYNTAINDKNAAYSALNQEVKNRQNAMSRLGLHDVKLDSSPTNTPTTPGATADANLAATTPKSNDSEAEKRRKELEAIQKAEEESYKKRLEALAEFENAKAENLADELLREATQEANRRNQEEQKYKEEVKSLEKRKSESKSDSEKKDIDKTIDILNKIDEEKEKTHQFKMLKIQQNADAKLYEAYVQAEQKRIDLQRTKDEEEINNLTSLKEAKALLKNNEYLQLTDLELRSITSLEDAKVALREVADRKMLAAQLKSLEEQKKILEQSLQGLTGEAAEKLKADLDTLYIKITHVKSAIKRGKDSDKKKATEEERQAMEQTDVLGFSAAQWIDTFNNLDTTEGKLKAVGMAFQALSNATSMYSELVQKLGEREIRTFERNQNKKRKELLSQLNQGLINQEEYHRGLELLETQTANKKAELEYKQAKADKIARMFGIVGSTAQAVATALTAGPIAGPILAGIVGALGAAQLAIVAAQPLPEKTSYATGGKTKGLGYSDSTGFEVAGTVHADEYVIPKWLRQDPVVAQMEDYIEAKRTGKNKPFAEGGETSPTANPETVSTSDPQLVYALLQFTEMMNNIERNGLFTYLVNDLETAKKLRESNKKLEKIENTAARKSV